MKYSFNFLVPEEDFQIETTVRIEKKKGVFKTELDTYKYFGGIYFKVQAEGKSVVQCIADLINNITNHKAFDPSWCIKDGMSIHEVFVVDDDPQSMRVIRTAFRVWAKNPEEAEKKIKEYNHFFEVESVKQM